MDTLLLLSLSCSSSYSLSCKLLQIRKLKTMAKCVKAKRMRRMQQKGVIVHANKVSQSSSLQFMKSVSEDQWERQRERGNKLAEQHAIYWSLQDVWSEKLMEWQNWSKLTFWNIWFGLMPSSTKRQTTIRQSIQLNLWSCLPSSSGGSSSNSLPVEAPIPGFVLSGAKLLSV